MTVVLVMLMSFGFWTGLMAIADWYTTFCNLAGKENGGWVKKGQPSSPSPQSLLPQE